MIRPAKRSPVHSARCTDVLEAQSEKPSTQRMRRGETEGVETQGPVSEQAANDKNKTSPREFFACSFVVNGAHGLSNLRVAWRRRGVISTGVRLTVC
jgi:hypothetical protein